MRFITKTESLQKLFQKAIVSYWKEADGQYWERVGLRKKNFVEIMMNCCDT